MADNQTSTDIPAPVSVPKESWRGFTKQVINNVLVAVAVAAILAIPAKQALVYLVDAVTPKTSPVGSIVAWGSEMTAYPAGWLPCDGKPLKIKEYRKLYDVIGTNFGGSNNEFFNLPDFQGRFLRGHDAGSGHDPDAKERERIADGGAIGDHVGSLQADATSAKGLKVEPIPIIIPLDQTNTTDEGTGKFTGGSGEGPETTPMTIPPHSHELTGAKETRPVNVSVVWLIRAE